MKVIVLGKNGMLGHMIYHYFNEQTEFETVGLDRTELDAMFEYNDIYEILEKYKPNIVINCIGLIHESATDPILTFSINSAFPHILADIGYKQNFKLIHISSDCYLDNTIYGKSKYAGEIDDYTNLTIRTSIIGPEIKPNGTGLFHWFYNAESPVKGYTIKWDGVTTLVLAEYIYRFIIENRIGLIDLRTMRSETKEKILSIIKDTFDLNTEIITYPVNNINRTNENPDVIVTEDYYSQISRLKHWIRNHQTLYSDIYEIR